MWCILDTCDGVVALVMMSERTVAAKFSPDRTAVKTSNFSSHGNLQPALHITLHQYRYNIDTPPIHAHRFCYVCTDEQCSCPFCTDQMVVVAAFSSCARILEEWLTTHSLPMLFLCLWVEIRSRTLIPLLRPGSVHNGSASWNDCGWAFPDKLQSCMWARFLIGVPTLCLHSGTVSPLHVIGSRVYASLGVTCHLHFWQSDQLTRVLYMPLQ